MKERRKRIMEGRSDRVLSRGGGKREKKLKGWRERKYRIMEEREEEGDATMP